MIRNTDIIRDLDDAQTLPTEVIDYLQSNFREEFQITWTLYIDDDGTPDTTPADLAMKYTRMILIRLPFTMCNLEVTYNIYHAIKDAEQHWQERNLKR